MRWLLVGMLLVAIAGTGLAIWQTPSSGQPAERAEGDASSETLPVHPTPEAPESEKPVPANTASTPAQSPLDLPPHWFGQNERVDQRLENLADTRPVISPDCAATANVDPRATVRDNLHRRLSVRIDDTLAHQALFTERTVFWDTDGVYYQMSAIWERDMPASYRIEFYRSSNPDFEQEVVPAEPPSGMPSEADALQAEQWLDRTRQTHQAEGAEPGADIRVSRVTERDDGGLHEITTMNGAMIGWSFGEGACTVNEDLTAFNCSCSDGGNRHDHLH